MRLIRTSAPGLIRADGSLLSREEPRTCFVFRGRSLAFTARWCSLSREKVCSPRERAKKGAQEEEDPRAKAGVIATFIIELAYIYGETCGGGKHRAHSRASVLLLSSCARDCGGMKRRRGRAFLVFEE